MDPTMDPSVKTRVWENLTARLVDEFVTSEDTAEKPENRGAGSPSAAGNAAKPTVGS
jgi:hypothetical protein